jgi:DNA-binding PucR family transcriptional regulator
MDISLRWATLTAVGLLTVGCATQQQTATVQCGVGGAAIGFLACRLLGNSAERCAAIAAVGAGVGAAACYSYAGNLEKRRKELAGRENDLDARLQYVRGLNEDAEKLNTELSERVALATRRSNELLAQVQAKRASAGELAKERAHLDDELKVANAQVALQRDAATEMKVYRAKRTAPSANLDAQIAQQDRLLAQTERHVETLASTRERIARS